MKTSGVRELKNRLSTYLRMVESGERVAVTHRGRIVAELGPPTHTTEGEAHAELRRRARAGVVRLGAPNRPEVIPASVTPVAFTDCAGTVGRRPGRAVNLYAETSAVLSWILDEERGARARSRLAAAAAVYTSDLTLIECDRALRRAAATGRVSGERVVPTPHDYRHGFRPLDTPRHRPGDRPSVPPLLPTRAGPCTRRHPPRDGTGGSESDARRTGVVVRRSDSRQRVRARFPRGASRR